MPQTRRRTITTTPNPPATGGYTVLPEEYRPDALDHLIERLSAGEPLAVICEDPLMPPPSKIRRWLASDASFKARYIDALRIHALTEGQKILAIADGTDPDARLVVIDEETGETRSIHVEDTARSKLRVDTRLKLLSKLEPEVFGDKIEHGHTVTGELAEMMKQAMNRGHHLPGEIGHEV